MASMRVYIVREPADHISRPRDIVGVYTDKTIAEGIAARPCGYIGGDKNRPVSSGQWVEEWEVKE